MSQSFVTLPEIERAARRRLPRDHYNFGAGGAETETTLRRNRKSLDRLAIAQNILVNVRQVDLSTRLLGVPLSWPVAVAPMGGLILFHPEGDVEMARGAARPTRSSSCPAPPAGRWRTWPRPARGPGCSSSTITETVPGWPSCSPAWRRQATCPCA